MAAAASATATAAAAATASPVMAAAVVAVAAAATGPLPDVAPMAAAAGDLLSGSAVGCGCCGGGASITRRGCRPMGRCNVRALAAAAGGGQAEEQPRGGWRGEGVEEHAGIGHGWQFSHGWQVGHGSQLCCGPPPYCANG